MENDEILSKFENTQSDDSINYDANLNDIVESAKVSGIRVVAIHNHPNGYPPTLDDCSSAYY